MSDEDGKMLEMKENFEEITECSICAETFTEPKILACHHTFCKCCMQQLITKLEKSTGEEVPCPICRQEFLIPKEGCDALQTNVFIENLIETERMLKSSSDYNVCLCEACFEGNGEIETGELPLAEVYCIDCRQRLCKVCHKFHLKSKLFKNHKTLNIANYQEIKKSDISVVSPFCEKHDSKQLEIFCSECEDVVCSSCLVESHKNHEFVTVESASTDIKKSMQQSVDSLLEFIPRFKEKIDKISDCKSAVIEKYKDLETDINKRREELKALIDTHSDTLLSKLNTKRDSYLKRIRICSDDIETHVSSIGSYETHCKQIVAFGTASAICKSMKSLDIRSNELKHKCESQMQDVLDSPIPDLGATLSLKDVESSIESYIGQDSDPLNHIYRAEPESVIKLRSISTLFMYSLLPSVIDFDILKDEFLAVIRLYCDGWREVTIEVYDLKTLWFKRKWEHPCLTNSMAIKSCERNNCLYILRANIESEKREIFRLKPDGIMISSWFVSDAVDQLSTTDETSVLCIAKMNSQLEEYFSDGKLGNIIPLATKYGPIRPIHAVKLSPDRFVVSYEEEETLRKMCLVDYTGNVLNIFAERETPNRLKYHVLIGKDSCNNILVLDMAFGQLRVFDSNLNKITETKELFPSHDPLSPEHEQNLYFSRHKHKSILDEKNRRIFYVSGMTAFYGIDIAAINFRRN